MQYKEWADTIVSNLSKNYRAALNGDRGFLLLHSTGSAPHKSEIDVPIVYADYYFLEALLRKSKLEKEGKAFVFAPSKHLNLGTFSKDAALEQKLYDLGVFDYKTQSGKLLAFLQK